MFGRYAAVSSRIGVADCTWIAWPVSMSMKACSRLWRAIVGRVHDSTYALQCNKLHFSFSICDSAPGKIEHAKYSTLGARIMRTLSKLDGPVLMQFKINKSTIQLLVRLASTQFVHYPRLKRISCRRTKLDPQEVSNGLINIVIQGITFAESDITDSGALLHGD